MAKERTLKLSLLAVATVVSCTGLVFGTHTLLQRLDPFAARKFEPESWAAARDEERAAMARDAIRNLPTGLLETDIEPLLGAPHKVIATHRLTNSGPRKAVRTYSYYLGCWSLAYYDSTFLWIHVGEDGRVISAEIGGG